jgi:hypothetical protein
MANTSKPLQIFKTGRHTAMSGATLAFSDSDLAASAAAYDPALFEAPIVVGHPKVDAPAYGWVKSVAFADSGLDAEPHQVDPAFAEMVAAGRFKKISAAFFAPNAKSNPVPGVFYLRHVGFLGAQAPAVQGLRTPSFSFADAEEGIVEFSEWDDVTNAGLWRSLRDWVIGKFGQEEADKVIPGYQVQQLEQAAQQEVAEAAAESDTGAPPSPSFAAPIVLPPQETSTVTPEQKAALEAENAQLKSKLADAEAANKATAAQQINQQNVAFADGLIGEGKLLPANKAVVVATMNLFASESPQFADGDSQKPLIDGFKTFLSGLSKRIEFAEMATTDKAAATASPIEFAAPDRAVVNQESLVTHQKALAYQQQNKVDYLTAIKAVGGR